MQAKIREVPVDDHGVHILEDGAHVARVHGHGVVPVTLTGTRGAALRGQNHTGTHREAPVQRGVGGIAGSVLQKCANNKRLQGRHTHGHLSRAKSLRSQGLSFVRGA